VAVDDWAGVRDAFDQATRWCVRTAPAGRGNWDELALGEWTVGDLLGHTSRALVTVESYLDKPAAPLRNHVILPLVMVSRWVRRASSIW
jgi:hypothetical protein